jgi:hypothetical protein
VGAPIEQASKAVRVGFHRHLLKTEIAVIFHMHIWQRESPNQHSAGESHAQLLIRLRSYVRHQHATSKTVSISATRAGSRSYVLFHYRSLCHRWFTRVHKRDMPAKSIASGICRAALETNQMSKASRRKIAKQ